MELYSLWPSTQTEERAFHFTSKKVVFSDIYGELPETTRTEHTFTGWFTEQTGGEEVENTTVVTINSDHTLYAHWAINQYTLTFDFDNGTAPEVRMLDFNEVIIYPEDPVRKGYTFAGWAPQPERMPAEDLTITAQWTPSKEKKPFNTALIAGITVPIGIIVIVVIVVVLVIWPCLKYSHDLFTRIFLRS